VALMHFAIHFVFANVRLEGTFHLLHVAAEVDPQAAFPYFFNLEALAGEPVGNVGNILVSGTKTQTEFFGRKESVIVRRIRILYFGKKLLQFWLCSLAHRK